MTRYIFVALLLLINTQLFAASVSSVTPERVNKNVSTTFTVKGSGLSSSNVFEIDGCGTGNLSSGSSTTRYFTCTPTVTGYRDSVIKSYSGGPTLKSFTTLVLNSPSISSISPSSATIMDSTTFTLSGRNLTNSLKYGMLNCDIGNLTANSTTKAIFTCTPNRSGSLKLNVTNAANSLIYTTNINVQSATVISIEPTSVKRGKSTRFAIKGADFHSSMEYSLNYCGNGQLTTGNSSVRYVTCAATRAGTQEFEVTDVDGKILKRVSINIVQPSVQSISPTNATLGDSTTFFVNGNNLYDTMTMELDNCGNGLLSSGSDTQRQFTCTPTSSGSKYYRVKTADGNTIDSGYIYVASPSVNSVTPSKVHLNRQTTFSVNGTNLSSHLRYYLANCGSGSLSSGNSSQRSFSCTPTSTGSKSGYIEDTSSNRLHNFQVSVVRPQVNNVSPLKANKNQNTTFTISGNDFAYGFQYELANCGSGYTSLSSSTSVTFTCTPSTIGAQTLYLRDSDGHLLNSFTIEFESDTPNYVNVDEWAQASAHFAISNEIIDVPTNLDLKGTTHATRAELATMLYRTLGNGKSQADNFFQALKVSTKPAFTDIKDPTVWFYLPITTLSRLAFNDQQRVFDSADDKKLRFNPANNISRLWATKALLETWDIAPYTQAEMSSLPTYSDLNKNVDGAGYIYKARDIGLLANNQSTVRPNDYIYRQELFVMIHRLLDNSDNHTGSKPNRPNVNSQDFNKEELNNPIGFVYAHPYFDMARDHSVDITYANNYNDTSQNQAFTSTLTANISNLDSGTYTDAHGNQYNAEPFCVWQADIGSFIIEPHQQGYPHCKVKWVAPYQGGHNATHVNITLDSYNGLGNRTTKSLQISLPIDSDAPTHMPSISFNSINQTLVAGNSYDLSGTLSDSDILSSNTGIVSSKLEYRSSFDNHWQPIGHNLLLNQQNQWGWLWLVPSHIFGEVQIKLTAVNIAGNTAEKTISVTVSPKLIIEGNVTDLSNNPVVNANVTITSGSNQIIALTTDDNGSFYYTSESLVVNQTYTIVALINDQTTEAINFTLTNDNPTAFIPIMEQSTTSPVEPPNPEPSPLQITSRHTHSCVLKNNEISCWGNNGDSTIIDIPTNISAASHINASENYTCAVANQQIHCWGIESNNGRISPPALTNVTTVATGSGHACAIANNNINCWGRNHDGQTTVPTNISNPTQIAAGSWNTCTVDDNGTQCWGYDGYGLNTIPPEVVNPEKIVMGQGHACALQSGRVYCWGANNSQQTVVPAGISDAIDIATGAVHSCAVRQSDISCWGYNNKGQSNPPTNLNNVTAISAGAEFTCASHAQGISCWGDNGFNQLDVPAHLIELDTDGDGILDSVDPDDDNDGVEDELDAFPRDPTETIDTDNDGIGNNADTDDDNDGVLDTSDLFPTNPNESSDYDSDGIGDNADTDDDNDGVPDHLDPTPRGNSLPAPFNEKIKLHSQQSLPTTYYYSRNYVVPEFVRNDQQGLIHSITESRNEYFDANGNFINNNQYYYSTYDEQTGTLSTPANIPTEYEVLDLVIDINDTPHLLLESQDKLAYTNIAGGQLTEIKPILNSTAPTATFNQTGSFTVANPYILNNRLYNLSSIRYHIDYYNFNGSQSGSEQQLSLSSPLNNYYDADEDALITDDGNTIYFVDISDSALVTINTSNGSANAYDLPYSYNRNDDKKNKTVTISIGLVAGSLYLVQRGELYRLTPNTGLIKQTDLNIQIDDKIADIKANWQEVNSVQLTADNQLLRIVIDYPSYLAIPNYQDLTILDFNPTTQNLIMSVYEPQDFYYRFSSQLYSHNNLTKNILQSKDIGDGKFLIIFQTEFKSTPADHKDIGISLYDSRTGASSKLGNFAQGLKGPFNYQARPTLQKSGSDYYVLVGGNVYQVTLNNMTTTPLYYQHPKLHQHRNTIYTSMSFATEYDGREAMTNSTAKYQSYMDVLPYASKKRKQLYPSFGSISTINSAINENDLDNLQVFNSYLYADSNTLYNLFTGFTISNSPVCNFSDHSGRLKMKIDSDLYLTVLVEFDTTTKDSYFKLIDQNCQVSKQIQVNDVPDWMFYNGKFTGLLTDQEFIMIGKYSSNSYVFQYDISTEQLKMTQLGIYLTDVHKQTSINSNKQVVITSFEDNYSYITTATLLKDVATPQVTAHYLTTNKIQLNWQQDTAASTFQVYRFDNNNWRLLTTTIYSNHIDHNITPNQSYQYKVVATNNVSSAEDTITVVSDLDTDGDGIYNNHDTDDDNDGVADHLDAFPLDASEYLDSDNDGFGNNSDNDDDNDGVLDGQDAFPLDPTENLDTDNDGIGNNTDTDDDNDGVSDSNDQFPLNPSESIDSDNDGIGNNSDIDDDNDGVYDNQDAFPLNPAESKDTDNDGIGNNADNDDDNDGVSDQQDHFPLDPNESIDSDNDGIGNNSDPDDDNDGVNDNIDNFPLDPNESIDSDNDGIGNNSDTDDDNDGVSDNQDAFPLNPDEAVDTDKDGIGNNADQDDDNDGISDIDDLFPLNQYDWADSDNDGLGNNRDLDDDNDGVQDGIDDFPFDPSEQLDTDGDGIGNNRDNDDDNDGILDIDDEEPQHHKDKGRIIAFGAANLPTLIIAIDNRK